MAKFQRPPVPYTDSKARADLIRSGAALKRHCLSSGNKKLIEHWRVVAAFIDVGLRVMDKAPPELVKDAAMAGEITQLLNDAERKASR